MRVRAGGSGWQCMKGLSELVPGPNPSKRIVYLGPERRPNKSIHKILSCQKFLSLVLLLCHAFFDTRKKKKKN